jgi:hypothetical protein
VAHAVGGRLEIETLLGGGTTARMILRSAAQTPLATADDRPQPVGERSG